MTRGRSLAGSLPAFFAAVVLTLVLAAPAGPRPTAGLFPGGPYFLVLCGFSHRNNDDPILHPGHGGRSHNHTYIGNRSVDASSTPASLRGGETTCDTPEDSSTYWVPTLYVGREPIVPLAGLVYYVRHTWDPVAAFPADLKMVAGNSTARRPQSTNVVSWNCGVVGDRTRYSALPVCPRNQAVHLRVDFPNCWNGRTRDSADHKSHMAYASGGRCPASHPVAVPTITLILLYPPVPARAAVSSGRFAAHADFINGWDQDALAALVARLN